MRANNYAAQLRMRRQLVVDQMMWKGGRLQHTLERWRAGQTSAPCANAMDCREGAVKYPSQLTKNSAVVA